MKNQYYDFICEKVDQSASHLLGVRQTLYLIRESLLYDQAGVSLNARQSRMREGMRRDSTTWETRKGG